MDSREPELRCPKCMASDSPILVVRGTGISSGGLSLQCRICQHTWSAEDLDHRRAS